MTSEIQSASTGGSTNGTASKESIVEVYYRKTIRFIEYYIFFCFLVIIVIPLLEFAWVPGFVKVVYLTGFPLLLAVILASFVREPLLEMLKRRFEPEALSQRAGVEK